MSIYALALGREMREKECAKRKWMIRHFLHGKPTVPDETLNEVKQTPIEKRGYREIATVQHLS